MKPGKTRRTPKLPRSPANRRDTQTVPHFSGFLIIRLLPGVVSKSAESLDAVTEEFKRAVEAAETLQRQIYENVQVGRVTLALCDDNILQ
jgi:hypothetical protein